MTDKQYKKGDLLICKPKDFPEDSFNDFNIYAEVLDVENDTVLLDKYMKCGQLHCGIQRKPLEAVSCYYQRMNNKEKERFEKEHDR